MRRILLAVALAVGLTGVVFVAPLGATGEPSQHIVEVTKVVENAPEGDLSFVVQVNCSGTVYNLNFDEDGGTQSVTVGDWLDGPQSCAISEPDDGGANDVEIDGSPCEFTGKDLTAVTEDTTVYPDEVCEVVIENSFETPTTTTTVAPPPGGETVVVVPTPITAQARFTG
jgi:hypothetical protein